MQLLILRNSNFKACNRIIPIWKSLQLNFKGILTKTIELAKVNSAFSSLF